jgi:hypothetical protein
MMIHPKEIGYKMHAFIEIGPIPGTALDQAVGSGIQHGVILILFADKLKTNHGKEFINT